MTVEEKALRDYGTTTVPEFAGYMLADGTMLNFSHEGRRRDVDHREIGEYFPRADCYYDGMVKFIARGNIRCSCNGCFYGFELSQEPTLQQTEALLNLSRLAEIHGLSFIIEKRTGNKVVPYELSDF